MAHPILSVVITTRNEAAAIAACIRSFDHVRDQVEVVVVDNASTDETKDLASACGAKVLDQGPERCAQRNAGWRASAADWVLILDADMILPAETVTELLQIAARAPDANACAAYWIPEVRTGSGFRVRVRNFERSFYDGTCIDALRLFSKSVLEATGGYDETLLPGGEDWELDIRILSTGARCALTQHHLIHDEKRLSFAKMLEKKAYYTRGLAVYRAKWPEHPFVRKQFSPLYRFVGVFVEKGKWRKILRHPILFVGVLCERLAVGFQYLLNRN